MKIFVFGSNEAGRHGAGAAKFAIKERGAIYGQGYGLQGQSFAIPTKSWVLKTLPIWAIKDYVDLFLDFAGRHPEMIFEVTRIGCGLAGYRDTDVAPLFAEAPANCELPKGWRP